MEDVPSTFFSRAGEVAFDREKATSLVLQAKPISTVLTVSMAMLIVKETYGADVGCTEDGRNGRIGATRYAGGNGTRKEAEKRNV